MLRAALVLDLAQSASKRAVDRRPGSRLRVAARFYTVYKDLRHGHGGQRTSSIPSSQRIAAALERLAPKPAPASDLAAADAFVWHAERQWLEPVKKVSRVDLDLLQGIDRVRDILLDNTRRFAKGLPANNVLLWGARGMGKCSLSRRRMRRSTRTKPRRWFWSRSTARTSPACRALLSRLRETKRRCLLFCDDLSFDQADTSYKSLKARARRRHRGPARPMSCSMPRRTAAISCRAR